MSSGESFLSINLVEPPRFVPPAVKCRLLFGGGQNQFGWIFFGFGMVFVWIFGVNTDPLGWYHFRGDLEEVAGVVQRCEETSFSQGGSEHSEGTPIFAHHYEFQVRGTLYKGVSYALAPDKRDTGAEVTVEFSRGNPDRSRIAGMRTAPFPAWAALVVGLFPLVGLCVIADGLRKGRKAIRLLTFGQQAQGSLKSKKATNHRVNKQAVHKMTFEFTDEMGRHHETVVKTHQTEQLEDDALEPLLYDPVRPSNATLLDHLPGSPQIEPNGEIRTSHPARSYLVLILPALTVLGHGLYAWWRFVAA